VLTRVPQEGESEDEIDRLPIQERVLSLGSGLSRLQTPDMPQYLDVIRFALDRLGWDEGGLQAYRVRIEYPVLHACVRMKFGEPRR
jgi:hypothetical protein